MRSKCIEQAGKGMEWKGLGNLGAFWGEVVEQKSLDRRPRLSRNLWKKGT